MTFFQKQMKFDPVQLQEAMVGYCAWNVTLPINDPPLNKHHTREINNTVAYLLKQMHHYKHFNFPLKCPSTAIYLCQYPKYWL